MSKMAAYLARCGIAAGLLWAPVSQAAGAGSSQRVAVGETPQGVDAEAWAGIQQQIAQAQYDAAPVPSDPGKASAYNPQQSLMLGFGRDGATFESRRNATGDAAAGPLKLQTLAMRRGAASVDAELVLPIATGARVEYRRDGWTEWFVNAAAGLEHGYTLDRRPLSHSAGPLRIALAVSGMRVSANADGSLLFSDDAGHRLRYDKLLVTDASGRRLQSTLSISERDRIEIAVDDTVARYPVVVDPLLVNEEQKIVDPGDGADLDYQFFGQSVAIESGTILVGAPYALGYGAAYVFTGSGSNWTLQQRLMDTDAATAGDMFGWSVALSGDTALIGAYLDHQGLAIKGSAFVFVRSGSSWTQQARLSHDDPPGPAGLNHQFGNSVALSGDTAVIGSATNNAFVFVRSGSSWAEQAVLPSANQSILNGFALSVAITGDTLMIGARSEDIGSIVDQGTVYVYTRSGTSWTQQAQLLASDGGQKDYFGSAIAMSGDTAVLGANGDGKTAGSAYVFRLLDSAWVEEDKLKADDRLKGDQFGSVVALSGDTALIGAPKDNGSGSAYMFIRNGTVWAQQAHLTAAGGVTAVALSADTALLGSSQANGQTGAGTVYQRAGSAWTQQTVLQPGTEGGTRDSCGNAISIYGDTLLVGCSNDDLTGFFQGSAYVFVRSAGGWLQQARFTGPAGSYLHFGQAVALYGDTALVSSPYEDYETGAVYVYVRSGSSWTQQARIYNNVSEEELGRAIALNGDTALISANEYGGSVFVYQRSGTVWSEQAQLNGTDQGTNDSFGSAVAIDGDSAVVGSSTDQQTLYSQGTAYVFVRSGNSWAQQAKLIAADPKSYSRFGGAVAISGDTVAIGASQVNATYIFGRSGTAWTQQAKLKAADGQSNDNFGSSVALSGDSLLIGAAGDAEYSAGAAYLFLRRAGAWTQQSKLIDANGRVDDAFGGSVALAGTTLGVGAELADGPAGVDSGAVSVFRIGTDYGDAPAPYPSLVADNGARHFINTDGPYLGNGIDADNDGQPNSGATGDDITGSDDEDGVSFGKLKLGQKANFTATVTAPAGTAQLDAWIDFNADGDWNDSGEQICDQCVVNAGSNSLKVAVPSTATPGQTYARFRVSPAGAGKVKSTGKLIFGEVEDYIVTIKPAE
ncbi:GEVED domain-containing protein [Hydrocarboniphaga sp.]|uniref:GEVED domain-containing protein n=1 Tax=Hydrocarboniphaga sp. TaxID=2033016 RepID=UPI003D15206E